MHHGCCTADASCQGSLRRRDRVGRLGKFAQMILVLCVNLSLTESEAERLGTAEAFVFAAYEAALAARIGRKFVESARRPQ